jgi:pimeloyl-ACP methyl ester carboxylesterase
MAIDASRIVFIHGSESNSQTYKAVLLRRLFPAMVVPDFTGPLTERMPQLESILDRETGWTIIGSSLGGLMAALFASRHPQQVRKLVLLAPALNLAVFSEEVKAPISIPCIIIHGTLDDVVPLEDVRALAEKTFPQLTFWVVEDDHRLHKTAETVDWETIIS